MKIVDTMVTLPRLKIKGKEIKPEDLNYIQNAITSKENPTTMMNEPEHDDPEIFTVIKKRKERSTKIVFYCRHWRRCKTSKRGVRIQGGTGRYQ